MPNSLNPAHPLGTAPGSVSIEVLWYSAGAPSSFSNAVPNRFRGTYRQTKAVVAAVGNTPSQNFQLVTDPTSINSSLPFFAQIGHEANGFFFDNECEEEDEN